MYFCEEDYEKLIKSLPAKAICENCGGEMVFVIKVRGDRRVFFYLCQNSKCEDSTEPFLINLV
ncbi:MAG: hypothetical protein JRG97_09130 [Deltaproteobacteria bacterium]|nr:hypothetical protein [Deltaproteobacteria bacterium]MBW2141220.1 hypothetical protein [Deltaproteobacteria bacterium]MBW2324292.1 hypothetical protein [Deltaproteobacteria bacterium]